MRSLFFQLSARSQSDSFTPTDNQTDFVLAQTPKDRTKIVFEVNQEPYREVDGFFRFDPIALQVTWLASVTFALKHTDRVRALYTI